MVEAGIPIVSAVDVGHKDKNTLTILRFSFPQGEPVMFALPTSVAIEAAKAILAQQNLDLGSIKN